MLVLRVVGLLLVVVTPVSGVESADIVQFVNLVAVQNNHHSALDWFVVVVEE